MTTALVTGASSGIGEAFARQLAARGDDLVVVARSEARLKELADELHTRHATQVEVFTADLSDRDDLARVEARLRDADRPVDRLVNNAGFGTAGEFVDLDVDREDQEIRLNVIALVRLTHAALGAMKARGAGAVVNVGSVGSFQPGPRNATYSATKAFVLSFSEAVHEELRGSGVTVLALCPGFTRTGFQEVGGFEAEAVPKFLWMTADEVVEDCLQALDKGKAVCVPGLQNKAATKMVRFAPRAVVRRMSGKVAERF